MTEPVRILQVVGSMERAGVETWLMHVLRNLDRERFQMDFLTHTQKECAYDREIASLGAKLYFCGNPVNPALYSLTFLKILKKHGPFHVVHSHMHYFNGLVMRLAQLADVPVRIAHSHLDTAPEDSGSSFPRRVYMQISRHWIQRCSSKRVAASNQAADSLLGAHWRSDPDAALLYCGLDFSPFQSQVDAGEVRRGLGFEPNELVIGHVGRFMPQKNHDFLLRIHAEILALRPDTRLLLVGQGPLEEKMLAVANDLGTASRVTFAGARADVPRLMRGAMDVFVMPSLFEGLGLAAVEAQAAGLPTFLSDQIPWEADTGCGLVQFLPLSRPPKAWAVEILKRAEALARAPREVPLSVSSSRFALQKSIDSLCQLYSVH